MTNPRIDFLDDLSDAEVAVMDYTGLILRNIDKPQAEFIQTLKTIAGGFVHDKDGMVVGIRMHYPDRIGYLTSDSKTMVAQKAIDNLKVVLDERKPLFFGGFAERVDTDRDWIKERCVDIQRRMQSTSSYSVVRNLRREMLDMVLDVIADHEGLKKVSLRHPTWAVGSRTYAVIVSKEHYLKAHQMSKEYGFRNCAVMMSYALTEYQALLNQEINYA